MPRPTIDILGKELDWDYDESSRVASNMRIKANKLTGEEINCDSEVVLQGVSNAETYCFMLTNLIKNYSGALTGDANNLDAKAESFNKKDVDLTKDPSLKN